MHSKMKGNLGEAAIAKDLILRGFAVFTELGDLSKIDLIAVKDGLLLRFQIKAASSKNGKISFDTRKSGPNYSFRYKEDQIDIFGFYCIDYDSIAYVSAKEFLKSKSIRTFRLKPPKNNQTLGVSMFSDFTLDRILRDYTRNTPPSKVEGNDIVQTTTEMAN